VWQAELAATHNQTRLVCEWDSVALKDCLEIVGGKASGVIFDEELIERWADAGLENAVDRMDARDCREIVVTKRPRKTIGVLHLRHRQSGYHRCMIAVDDRRR
jgi:hypothetical protein